jgi:hypothetical protein
MILAAAQHTTVVNQGLLSSTFGQIVAGVIVLIIGGVGTMLIRALRSMITKIDGSVEATREVHDAVAGRAPSPLEPNPPPGLISVATGHTVAILDTAEQVKVMAEHQLAQNGKVVTIQNEVGGIKTMVQALVADIRSDSGHTMRDQVDSIVVEQARVADALQLIDGVAPVEPERE